MKPRLNLTQVMTALVIGSLLLIGSCSKENSHSGTSDAEEEQASMVSSEADGEAEMIFNGIFDDVMGANDDVGMAGTGIFGLMAPSGGGVVQRPNSCFILTVTHLNAPDPFPVRIDIDFGTVVCQGADGHVRSGKISIQYTSRLIVPGAIATVTFDNFYIDSIKIEGTLAISNTGSAISRQFTVDVTDAKLSKPNGNFTEWTSHKVITQQEGLGTPNLPLDDVFKIEGDAHGRVQRANLLVAWEGAVTDPLIKRFNCRWIVKGEVKQNRINTGGNSPWAAILDFGTGDCDNKAVVTINGVAHNITLH
jgi:hypothetical protein